MDEVPHGLLMFGISAELWQECIKQLYALFGIIQSGLRCQSFQTGAPITPSYIVVPTQYLLGYIVDKGNSVLVKSLLKICCLGIFMGR